MLHPYFRAIDGKKIECKHCTNDDGSSLEIIKDNPGGITILCGVCSKETVYERRKTD